MTTLSVISMGSPCADIFMFSSGSPAKPTEEANDRMYWLPPPPPPPLPVEKVDVFIILKRGEIQKLRSALCLYDPSFFSTLLSTMESGRVTQNPLVLEEVSPAAEKLGISPPPSSAAANDSYEQSIYRIFNKQKDQGKKPLQQQQRQAIIHISQPTLATPTLIHQILDGKGPLIELAAAQDQHKLSHKHGVKFVKNPELRQTTGFSAAAVEAETTANYPATTSDSASLLTVSPRLGYSAQTPQTSMKSVSKSSSNSSLLKPSFESVSNTTLSSNPHHYHPRLRHRASLPAFSHHTANLQHPTRSSSLLSSSNTVAAGSSAGPLKKVNAAARVYVNVAQSPFSLVKRIRF